MSVDEIRRAIDAVAPAIELVDYQNPARGLEQIVASGAFHAATVLGAARAPDDEGTLELARSIFAAPPDSPLPRLVGDSSLTVKRIAELSPSDLLEAARHVAALLGRYGESFRTGDWLICGSLVRPASVSSRAEADFGALGSVRVVIEKAKQSSQR